MFIHNSCRPSYLSPAFCSKGVAGDCAQVLFALTPVWSTVVAVAVLHEAQPSGLELLGGGLILTASLLATREKA